LTAIMQDRPDALIYRPSTASWAIAEIVTRPPRWVARLALYSILLAVVGFGVFSKFCTVAETVRVRGAVRSTGSAGAIAELAVPHRDVADVEAGMPVFVTVDAVPLQDCRGVEGRIRSIGDIVLPEGGGHALAHAAVVDLNASEIECVGQRLPLRVGAALVADIRGREKTLAEILAVEFLRQKK
jgi:hypothetical protein